MPLASGSRIGPYEISSRIGAGGMGEVFRAVDVNLGRAAAIKVLPSALAADPDRMARFEREAQTLASLNHPNIAQVFGFEKSDPSTGSGQVAFRALAMEFVEGPTLAERINGAPIPIEDAIPIAIQIADALESAHDHGIIHRDLKPQNIKVRPDGTVKVLDFGLAKAIAPSADGSSSTSANSPTITTPAMTHAGVVLGTASYMSPEQAKGRVVDRRADIWAFGCVLFEMLSGKRVFDGPEVSDVYVSVLRDEPPWPTLPASTPPHVKSLLRRCLQKDVRKRLPHIGVARLELAEPAAEPVQAAPAAPVRRVTWQAAAAATLVFAIVLGVPAWYLWSRPAPAPTSPVHVRIDLGTSSPLGTLAGAALSPDGRTLAFAGARSADVPGSAIYVRPLDRLDAQQLVGTEGGAAPFFSPDGKWIAFFASATLKKVASGGGPVITICPAAASRGGSWADNDTIVFATSEGLNRVSAAGGTAQAVTRTPIGEPPPALPQVLPRGRGILYQQTMNSDPATGTFLVQGPAGSAPKEVERGGRNPRYVASGHLTFVRSGTLFALPFDLDALEARGDAVPVVEGIFQAAIGAQPTIAISESGTLAFLPGAAGLARLAPLMWLTQAGPLTPLRAAPASFAFPRFSPDGRRVAMSISDGRQFDIWVYDWERDILTRVTTDPGTDLAPVWTPDGTALVYGSSRGSNTGANLYWQRADGTGAPERLTTSDQSQLPDSIDPEGKVLVFHEGDPTRGRQSLGMLPLERDGTRAIKAGTPSTLIAGAFLKANARISPDGKWIAYAANDTGPFEIYVQPFPGLGERVQVSNAGGNLVLWSQKKNELYYSGPGPSRLMVVPYTVSGSAFLPSKPRQWSQTPFSGTPPVGTYGPGLDIHPDGERFAVTPVTPRDDAAVGQQLVLVFNFFEELRRTAPRR